MPPFPPSHPTTSLLQGGGARHAGRRRPGGAVCPAGHIPPGAGAGGQLHHSSRCQEARWRRQRRRQLLGRGARLLAAPRRPHPARLRRRQPADAGGVCARRPAERGAGAGPGPRRAPVLCQLPARPGAQRAAAHQHAVRAGDVRVRTLQGARSSPGAPLAVKWGALPTPCRPATLPGCAPYPHTYLLSTRPLPASPLPNAAARTCGPSASWPTSTSPTRCCWRRWRPAVPASARAWPPRWHWRPSAAPRGACGPPCRPASCCPLETLTRRPGRRRC